MAWLAPSWSNAPRCTIARSTRLALGRTPVGAARERHVGRIGVEIEAIDRPADHLLFPVVVEIGQQRGAGSAHRRMDVAVDPRRRHRDSSGSLYMRLRSWCRTANVPPIQVWRKTITAWPPCPASTPNRPAPASPRVKYSSPASNPIVLRTGNAQLCPALGRPHMKSVRLAILAALLLPTAAFAGDNGPSTVSGPNALALAGLVALYSPLLSGDERETAAALFVGEKDVPYAKKITITADKIVCRVSNVDITARSCELTFRGKKQTIAGRRANEVFATEALAGVASDGA